MMARLHNEDGSFDLLAVFDIIFAAVRGLSLLIFG